MQLVMFVRAADILEQSQIADAPHLWGACDILASTDEDDATGVCGCSQCACDDRWQGKFDDVDCDPDEYRLNEVPLPYSFTDQGRFMLRDGHHRIAMAAEQDVYVAVCPASWNEIHSSREGYDWYNTGEWVK